MIEVLVHLVSANEVQGPQHVREHTQSNQVFRHPKGLRGQSLVEFASIASILFLLVFAVLEFGRGF